MSCYLWSIISSLFFFYNRIIAPQVAVYKRQQHGGEKHFPKIFYVQQIWWFGHSLQIYACWTPPSGQSSRVQAWLVICPCFMIIVIRKRSVIFKVRNVICLQSTVMTFFRSPLGLFLPEDYDTFPYVGLMTCIYSSLFY